MKYLLIVSRILNGDFSKLILKLINECELKIYLVGDGVYNIKMVRIPFFTACRNDLEMRGVKADGLSSEEFYDRLVWDLMEWCDKVVFI
ncbi:MAG: hypothetical protein QXY40_02975 [Candidatus Methanomethylicia archaeon]